MRGLNTLKLRMAHYISNNSFDGPPATRIPVENLELIRARRPDPLGERAAAIRYKTDRRVSRRLPVIHDSFANRSAPRVRRCIIQVSALSTLDGRIEAYHGGDG